MRRRSTFEDFEELLDSESSDLKNNMGTKDSDASKPKRQEIEFDSEFIRQPKRPRIPANGSEWFEETEDADDPVIFEEVGAKKSDVSAEERYRQREQKLRKKAEHRRRNRHTMGKFLAVLQFLLSVLLMVLLYRMDVLPMKYFAAAGAVLAVTALFCFLLQFRPKAHWFGKILSVVICIGLIVGDVYIARTMGTLDSMTTVQTYKVDKIAVAVMEDDPAKRMKDMTDYEFGIMDGVSRSKIDQAVEMINEDLDCVIGTTTYTSYSKLVSDLYAGKIGAIIFNQSLTDLIEENNPGFSDKIRIVEYYEVRTDMLMDSVPDLAITKTPFVLYLSGMDVYGELEQTSRSDVNILACVNPKTKQILLVTVPRDAYVEIPGITDGAYDKLTHAGMYGVQYSMDAMETIFDEDIDYYVRINFTALIDIVDALGGIDVEVDYAFSTYHGKYDPVTDTLIYYDFKKGTNHLDGIHALAFARERKSLDGGDYERGKNQQKVITALLQKAISPAILTGYSDLLASLEGCMDTSLSSQQISSLVKMQLRDGAEWNIVSMNVTGYTSDEYCATYSDSTLSVEILDEDSVEAVKEVIAQLMAGEIIEKPAESDTPETETEEIYREEETGWDMDMEETY